MLLKVKQPYKKKKKKKFMLQKSPKTIGIQQALLILGT